MYNQEDEAKAFSANSKSDSSMKLLCLKYKLI